MLQQIHVLMSPTHHVATSAQHCVPNTGVSYGRTQMGAEADPRHFLT